MTLATWGSAGHSLSKYAVDANIFILLNDSIVCYVENVLFTNNNDTSSSSVD